MNTMNKEVFRTNSMAKLIAIILIKINKSLIKTRKVLRIPNSSNNNICSRSKIIITKAHSTQSIIPAFLPKQIALSKISSKIHKINGIIMVSNSSKTKVNFQRKNKMLNKAIPLILMTRAIKEMILEFLI